MDKKLLTKRVNFPSIQDILDSALPSIERHFNFNEKQTQQMRDALTTLFSNLLSDVRFAVELGANKGISEALAIMEDPDYYETVKNRKLRRNVRDKEWQDQQKKAELERKQRIENPTYEDKQNRISIALSNMVRSKDKYHDSKKTIENIIEKDGSQILVNTIKDKFKLPDIWFESFDIDEFVEGLTTKKISDKNENDDLDDFFDKSDIIN